MLCIPFSPLFQIVDQAHQIPGIHSCHSHSKGLCHMGQIETGSAHKCIFLILLKSQIPPLAKASGIGTDGNISQPGQIEAVIVMETVNRLCHCRNLTAAGHTVFSRPLMSMGSKDTIGMTSAARRDQQIHRHPYIRFHLQKKLFPQDSSVQHDSFRYFRAGGADFHFVHSQKLPQAFLFLIFPSRPFFHVRS